MEKITILENKVNKVEPASKSDTKGTKCMHCDETFSRNCELESHIEKEHESAQKHECNICGKTFILKWRMRKHMGGHEDVTKCCHYFNNNLPCPYEHIGCMFQHKSAGKCKASTCTRHLCQFEHESIADEDTTTIQEDVGEVDDHDDDNCHLCRNQFFSQDALIEHMQTVHIDIFILMAERNQFIVED